MQLYLFFLTQPQQILGAVFTSASRALYVPYADAPRLWPSLSNLSDQAIGGPLMWVDRSTVSLFGFTLVFFRWVAANEAADRPTATTA